MDRTQATSSFNTALTFAGIAIGIFALTFVVAIIYIG
jgi:hypothetical protein